jgi:hypothetical protein
VRGFDASGELKAEYLIPDSWTLERLRELFETADDDPMFDSFPLGPRQASALGDAIGRSLASAGLDLFLEADVEP